MVGTGRSRVGLTILERIDEVESTSGSEVASEQECEGDGG